MVSSYEFQWRGDGGAVMNFSEGRGEDMNFSGGGEVEWL